MTNNVFVVASFLQSNSHVDFFNQATVQLESEFMLIQKVYEWNETEDKRQKEVI